MFSVTGMLCALFCAALVAGIISTVEANTSVPAVPWYKPIKAWVVWLHDYLRVTPEEEAQGHLREIWKGEDSEYTEQMRLAGGPMQRKELMTARKTQLKERAAARNALRGYTWGGMFSFLICLLALPLVLVASYYLKIQVAKEFLVGSADLEGLQIGILGASFEVHTTDLVATGLILLEVIGGVLLSHSSDRLWQITKGDLQEPAGRYKVLQGLAIVMMVALICLEAGLGVFRGELEAQGEAFATAWMVGISIVVPVMTMACSYVVKSQIGHVAGPLSGLFWTLIFIGLVLLTGPSLLIAWLVLAVAWSVAKSKSDGGGRRGPPESQITLKPVDRRPPK